MQMSVMKWAVKIQFVLHKKIFGKPIQSFKENSEQSYGPVAYAFAGSGVECLGATWQ